jgi:nucleotide-binding universal stress UspA family protein
LLVVGARGRNPVTSLLLGSTSENCARHAHCPVMVTHPPKSGPPAARLKRSYTAR